MQETWARGQAHKYNRAGGRPLALFLLWATSTAGLILHARVACAIIDSLRSERIVPIDAFR